MGYDDYEPVSSMAKSTKCICPRCEKIHYRLIFWTGNGIPRKMCPICYKTVKDDNVLELDESHINQDITKKIK